jgi:shikimate kinase
MPRYERDRRHLGDRGHLVFLRGPDMILSLDTPGKASERNFTPEEAMQLLEWLYSHRDELYQACQQDEQDAYERRKKTSL